MDKHRTSSEIGAYIETLKAENVQLRQQVEDSKHFILDRQPSPDRIAKLERVAEAAERYIDVSRPLTMQEFKEALAELEKALADLKGGERGED